MALKRGQVPKPKTRRRKPARPSAMVRLPFSATQARRILLGGAAVVTLLVLGVTAWLLKLPEQLWLGTADVVADAGFEVRTVEVSGLKHMAKLPVYTAALDARSNSMLLVDLDDVRDRLKLLPWVADASVARRLPDTLVVDIVERVPVAIWQYRQRLAVVDATGHVLDTRTPQRFAHLPLIIGRDAHLQAGKLARLLTAYPDVRTRVESANWLGERRWDLRFKSGETLALPEGYARAQVALDNFTRMEREGGLLDRGFARFDMRLPDRMVVRVSNEPGVAARALAVAGTEI